MRASTPKTLTDDVWGCMSLDLGTPIIFFAVVVKEHAVIRYFVISYIKEMFLED